jgi:LuxR family quorum-sensing system transcriptional regulator SinR
MDEFERLSHTECEWQISCRFHPQVPPEGLYGQGAERDAITERWFLTRLWTASRGSNMITDRVETFSDLEVSDLMALDSAVTEQGLADFISKITQRLGLRNAIYHCPTFPGRTITDPFLVLTYDEEWVDHYKKSDYVSIDPVFNVGARSVLPVDWSTLEKKDRKVVKLFNEAHDAGVGRQGLTVPIRGPENGLWALFSVTSEDTDREWRSRLRGLTREVLLLAHFIHQKAYELYGEGETFDLNAITRREREALNWTAEGKTVFDIAALMKISPETVKAHLDSARHKLGALNRVHAVTKAIRAGLVR